MSDLTHCAFKRRKTLIEFRQSIGQQLSTYIGPAWLHLNLHSQGGVEDVEIQWSSLGAAQANCSSPLPYRLHLFFKLRCSLIGQDRDCDIIYPPSLSTLSKIQDNLRMVEVANKINHLCSIYRRQVAQAAPGRDQCFLCVA